MAPQLISIIVDFSLLGEAKGILEALLGQDLIIGQELQTWERLLALIPAGRSVGKISRTINAIEDAENLLRNGGKLANEIGDVGRAMRRVEKK